MFIVCPFIITMALINIAIALIRLFVRDSQRLDGSAAVAVTAGANHMQFLWWIVFDCLVVT